MLLREKDTSNKNKVGNIYGKVAYKHEENENV